MNDAVGAERLRRRLEALLGIPMTEGNAVDVYRNGDEIFPAMLDAIRGAERTVDLMTYVYWSGDIARRVRRCSGRDVQRAASECGC